ncbi:MAG: hypothetical protein NC033_05000 [Clostridiales bacterium]|nr:hypothetical protein [Clostridiales bacterium]
MANDNELENVPDGDPVVNTEINSDTQNNVGESPTKSIQLNELVIWLIGLIVFIVPYVVVISKVHDWNKSFGEMSLFLTYMGFLVSPLCATVMHLKKRKKGFSLTIFSMGVAFIALYCVYEGGYVPLAIKIINNVSLVATIAISLTVYILIDKQTRKKLKVTN